MNTEIKLLEQIGQSASLQQHESLLAMLEALNIDEASLMKLQKKEFVCILVPDDDDDDDTNDAPDDDTDQ